MVFNIKDRFLELNLERHLSEAQRDASTSLERLSSGSVFTRNDPQPSDRALAEGLEFKLRGLAASKRNINSAVSLLQTAEASLSQVSDMILRMKEINTSAASTTVSDRDRAYLFVEYQALHDEVNRIAQTTEFNGIPLLNGNSMKTPESLVFRVGDPTHAEGEGNDSEDLNAIKFDGLKAVVATTQGLGLKSARELLDNLEDDGGISLSSAQELLEPEDSDRFATSYEQALDTLSNQRATFGGLQARLNRTIDFLDVYQENIAAAKSSIADVDYAKEVASLAEARIRMQAGTAVLAQGNINSHLALNLLNSIG